MAIGQEAWLTALRVIRFAEARVLLKGADGQFSCNSKQGESREPHKSKGNLMQGRRGGCCDHPKQKSRIIFLKLTIIIQTEK